MEIEPPVNKEPPKQAALVDALAEQLLRETGPDGDPDGYLKRDAPPTPAQRAHRDAAVKANQPEKLN